MADERHWGDCFTIIPFGKKSGPLDLTGAPNGPKTVEIDFDDIFKELICPALAGLGLKAQRTVEYDERGLIRPVIFLGLKNEDYALIDATFHNANAFYELGVRHAYRDRTTVAIAAKGTRIPFDIHDVHFFFYEVDTQGRLRDAKAAVAELREHCRGALKARIDSPVLHAIGEDRQASRKMPDRRRFDFSVADASGARLGILTGDLKELSGLDAWVNSENNYMEPARIPERSISSAIRHLAADYKDGKMRRDWMAEGLKKAIGAREPPFEIGTVLITPPGRLKTRGVRRIVHVASVTGTPGSGFRPHHDLGQIVDAVLMKIADHNGRLVRRGGPLRSVVLPAFGTGQAGARIEVASDILVRAAISSLQKICRGHGKRSQIREVFFLAYDERALRAFHRTMNACATDKLLLDFRGDPIQEILKGAA